MQKKLCLFVAISFSLFLIQGRLLPQSLFARYSMMDSLFILRVLLPGCQLAGQTSPCSSVNWNGRNRQWACGCPTGLLKLQNVWQV